MRQSPRVVALLVAVLATFAMFPVIRPASAEVREAPVAGTEDEVANSYHRLLLEHTHWVESVWDETAGHYKLADEDFAVVLGNAVVLKFGDYDEQLAGVSRAVLQDHTIRTIQHFAATDRWVDPNGEWGGSHIYFDSTFESYFIAGAHLMWADLDAQTRANVDAITRGIANYVTGLGAGEDPGSAGWLTNGLRGGYRADTKLEEMGARTMPLSAALAYLPNDPSAPSWREWLDRWSSNMAGLPAADQANPTTIDGTPVARWNTAQNIYDTFAVENHGSYAAHYQEAVDAYPGRNTAQFLIAGAPVPSILMGPPNAAELSRTLRQLGTDSGVAAYPMVADRYHLYGRDVLPLAYQSVVMRNADAARAERMLLAHLEPYLHYAPEFRLTKFSGQPNYEPEARAELAMAFLLHHDRARFGGGAQPVSEQDYFRRATSVVDYGSDVGMLAQQSPKALAAAISKPGFVKFAYLPGHDDWLFDTSANAPSFIPSTAVKVTNRSAHVYRRVRDGADASATLLRTSAGFAGYTTLPTGTVVYATSGLGSGEGALRVFNLNMPGVAGLDGDRTYYGAGGQATLAPVNATVNGDSTVHEVTFPATQARYVRVLGVRPATQYGYSIWDFEVRDGDGSDLAVGKPASASSSYGTGYEASRATDGDTTTRWAVSTAERSRQDSWLQVDLGSEQQVSKVRLNWETAAIPASYRIQVSGDGNTWQDVASVPKSREFHGDWLNLDGRVGFVVHGSTNPIRVDPQNVTLSDGPATGAVGMVVEARPNQDAAATATAAGEPVPSGGPATLRASEADGYLSLFNLGGDPIANAPLTLPRSGTQVRLYRGDQRTVDGGTSYDVSLPAADARVEPPRFLLAPSHAGDTLPALSVTVTDSRTVSITNLEHSGIAGLKLRTADGSDSTQITLPAGHSRTVTLGQAPLTPVADLALTQITYPTSPLPAGMTDPDLAVDGDSSTAWRPGSGNGRMVVDLGAGHSLASAKLRWTAGPVAPFTVSTSDDGLTYRAVAGSRVGSPPDTTLALGGASGRYVAIQVNGWNSHDASLAGLSLSG